MWLLAFFVLLNAISVYGPKVDQLRESVTNQEHRAFIKCHVLLGTPAVEVHRMLDKIARNRALSKTHVYRLYNVFKDGSRLSSEEDPRSGRPRTARAHRPSQPGRQPGLSAREAAGRKPRQVGRAGRLDRSDRGRRTQGDGGGRQRQIACGGGTALEAEPPGR